MANGRLSFKIAVSLATEGFNRGKNVVKSGLLSLQMRVVAFTAALGAGGIGLTNFISRLVDAAKETNSVQTALKNVSGSLGQFASNQKYLLELSKKYGVNINTLTGSFAKFTAAANVSGMSIDAQRKIFESVSRATVAFGLNAEDTRGVFLALSQMMSKGKVSSEELRLQMSERLPVAIQAMAKAVGVSVGELDGLLKKGKVLSGEVLPGFAEALDEMLPNVDVDNINTSLNKLQNTIIETSNKLDISGKFKWLVDTVTSTLQAGADNIKGIISMLWGVVAGVVGKYLISTWKSWTNYYDNCIKGAEDVTEKALKAVQRRGAREKALRIEEKKLEAAQAAYKVVLAEGTAAQRIKAEEKVLQAEKAVARQKQLLSNATYAAEIAKQKAAAKSAGIQSMRTANGFTRALNIVKMQLGRFAVAVKALWASMGWTVVISAVISLVAHFRNLYKETKRVKEMQSEYKKELEVSGNTAEVQKLQSLKNIVNDTNRAYSERQGALSELNKLLNTNYSINEKTKKINGDINKDIETQIKLLGARARLDYLTQKKISNEEEWKAFEKEYWQYYSVPKTGFGRLLKNTKQFLFQPNRPERLSDKAKAIRSVGISIEDDIAKTIAEIYNITGGNDEDDAAGNNKDKDTFSNQTELQKQEQKYAESLAELDYERQKGWITESEYNKALDDLTRSMLRQAVSSGDREVLQSKYFKALEKAADNPLYDSRKADIEKIEKEYAEKISELENQLRNGAISQEEYNENIDSLNEATVKSLGAILTLDEAVQNTTYQLARAGKEFKLSRPKVPELESRDATFDYKKDNLEIAEENLRIARDNAEAIRQAFEEGATELEAELNTALSNVKSLEDALKIAQVKKDIKELKKEFSRGLFTAVRGGVSGIDNIVSAFTNIKETMNDVDASGWEKIMSIWNGLTSVVDSFLSIIETIRTLTEITEQLKKAKQAEALIDKTTTQEKVLNASTGATAISSAAATEAAANTRTVAGNTAAAASGAAKSVAGIPVVGLAMAMAAVGAILALMSSLPKFAKGGIVTGGPTVGDKILARVNAGEMILNQGQQDTIYGLLNRDNGPRSISLSGKFELEGRKLVALIGKEVKYKSRTR